MAIGKNGEPWYTEQGEELHAHGGHILADRDGYYYWYGEDRREGRYVSVYRSRDLRTWEFRNAVLTVDSPVQESRVKAKMALYREVDDAEFARRQGTGVNPVLVHNGRKIGKINVERPKVLYCAKTGKYVMWAHYENGVDYLDAACLVATCDTPDGDFVYHGAFNPFGAMSRDCTLYAEEDGTAYFISTARDNLDLHIYRLTPDYMNVSRLVNTPFQGELREAPALYRRNGRIYLLSSYCTGWKPNQGKWAVADSIEGDFSLLEDFGDETTFRSQPAFVLQKDGRDIYVGDRWEGSGDKYFTSSYIVLEIQYQDGKPSITYTDTPAF